MGIRLALYCNLLSGPDRMRGALRHRPWLTSRHVLAVVCSRLHDSAPESIPMRRDPYAVACRLSSVLPGGPVRAGLVGCGYPFDSRPMTLLFLLLQRQTVAVYLLRLIGQCVLRSGLSHDSARRFQPDRSTVPLYCPPAPTASLGDYVHPFAADPEGNLGTFSTSTTEPTDRARHTGRSTPGTDKYSSGAKQCQALFVVCS